MRGKWSGPEGGEDGLHGQVQGMVRVLLPRRRKRRVRWLWPEIRKGQPPRARVRWCRRLGEDEQRGAEEAEAEAAEGLRGQVQRSRLRMQLLRTMKMSKKKRIWLMAENEWGVH